MSEYSGKDVMQALQKTMANNAGQNVEGIALVEIFSALRKIRCGGSWKSAAGYIIRQSIYIYLIMLIKKYMTSKSEEKGDKSSWWDIFQLEAYTKNLLDKYYVTHHLCLKDSPDEEFWQGKYSVTLWGFKVEILKPTYNHDRPYEIRFIPFLHQAYVDGLLTARDSFLVYKHKPPIIANKFYSHNGAVYAKAQLLTLYPSSNYKLMEERIRRLLLSCMLANNFKPVGWLINGPPGLGKTELSRYLADKMECNTFRINASDPCFLHLSVDDLVGKMWINQVTIKEPVIKPGYSSQDKPGVYDTTTPMII